MLNERMTDENSIRDHKIYLLNREVKELNIKIK